ncbi:MAG TPA: UDP-N-acetylmuramoyl-tripeptide--D-alanyl-D-alanine ligase [Dehalococcoidia bacterium]|jgi:UDP-N-acetylmuramoyl-tripeptide--D-alanyl-D-alanine ligase|nr:UDP-N-acetylmuramoyl-tripeptide--D-alanyl-D-alanine ligase [Dehalococcoidia bacterium]
MESKLTVADIWEGLGGALVASDVPGHPTFERGLIDSREARAGDLFFALPGERADGHDFVASALSAGAAGAVVGRAVETPEGSAVFIVSNPLNALQRLAAMWRRRHEARVIAVTGSVGKTTVKELIASVLSHRFRVLKSEANLNTEIGIPLTLLNLRPEHERAVLEFGMYQPGDVALLARIGKPAVGVVTNVSYVHLERVRSFGRIVAAKAELVEALPADGLAVLNGDDANVAAMSRRTRARSILYGLSEQCDVRATDVTSRGLDGFSFRLQAGGSTLDIDCPLPGKHHVYPALAAAAVALEEGMTPDEVASALREARLDLRLTVRTGPNGSTIIDDSYNASPASMIAALDLLSESKARRRIAVLGHMRELGAAEDEGHEQVGRHAATTCDVLMVCGEDARLLAEAARAAGHTGVRLLATPEETAETLRQELREGDVCLVKASRAVGLESVVEALVRA